MNKSLHETIANCVSDCSSKTLKIQPSNLSKVSLKSSKKKETYRNKKDVHQLKFEEISVLDFNEVNVYFFKITSFKRIFQTKYIQKKNN